MSNITNEGIASPKIPTIRDKKTINDVLKDNFGHEASYNHEEKTIYLCNNDILNHKEFVSLLTKYKVFINPSLF